VITRPLDLASRLRAQPRNFDGLFFVNAVLIGLFFVLFGSRYVMGPGLDVELPEIVGANSGARTTTHYVRVVNAGQIFAGDGLRELPQLSEWLEEQAASVRQPTLQIQAARGVELSVVTEISGAARRAGFVEIQIAATELAARAPRGKR
jgi:biopolymer transport protein ExbD